MLQRPAPAPYSLAQLHEATPAELQQSEHADLKHVRRSDDGATQTVSSQDHGPHGAVLALKQIRLELVSNSSQHASCFYGILRGELLQNNPPKKT